MKKSNQCGFTLLELIIVIILTGIIVGVATMILQEGFNAILKGKNLIDANWQGRIALERMTRDMLGVRSRNDISTATASQFTFTDSSGTSISYNLSGTTLLRNSIPLADGIQSLTFSYADKNGVSTSTTTDIRYVSTSLNVTQGGANFTISTSVYPRNLL